jgi:succinate-semialdehyde dehydrogenase / glutarate-semialdehyde dehydrogenase
MTSLIADPVASVPPSLYIGGQWRESSTGATFAVENPATGEVLARVADASPEDARAAMDAACAAAEGWAATPPRVRGELLRAAFDLLQERADSIAAVMTLEMGKPLAEAHGEIGYGGDFLRWFAEEAVRISGRYGRNPAGTGTMIVSQHPVGPSYLITPWNFPLAMAARKLGPALAAGCTVVIKPASLTPLTTLAVAQLLEEVGVPAGVVNVLTTTSSSAVSAPILADPRLRKLSFTGSTEVGVALMRQSAGGVLRTSMELGGNAPFLVFEDADLDRAVDGAMAAKFRNIGQACTAANRFLVHESVAEEFASRLSERVRALRIGPGVDPQTQIGPLIDEDAITKTSALVDDAVAHGATLRVGGARIGGPGHFFAPTVVTDVRAGSDILREEIFGPVVAIVPFRDEDEAVALANGTQYGLVAYAYTRDLDRGRRLIDRLATGMMGLNSGVVSDAAAPFGGIKQSGLGREGGSEGIHEYLETKYTLLAD